MHFDEADVGLCEHCKVKVDTVHEINAVPEVPTALCTSRKGCICQVDSIDDKVDRGEEA